ncbi:hypothetical protein OIO90_001872 [Microbotryomycetes sp. JL221]|nr:hypothetical protein OIO90_001872 [Microbotryomycetes sp. JL221]
MEQSNASMNPGSIASVCDEVKPDLTAQAAAPNLGATSVSDNVESTKRRSRVKLACQRCRSLHRPEQQPCKPCITAGVDCVPSARGSSKVTNHTQNAVGPHRNDTRNRVATSSSSASPIGRPVSQATMTNNANQMSSAEALPTSLSLASQPSISNDLQQHHAELQRAMRMSDEQYQSWRIEINELKLCLLTGRPQETQRITMLENRVLHLEQLNQRLVQRLSSSELTLTRQINLTMERVMSSEQANQIQSATNGQQAQAGTREQQSEMAGEAQQTQRAPTAQQAQRGPVAERAHRGPVAEQAERGPVAEQAHTESAQRADQST